MNYGLHLDDICPAWTVFLCSGRQQPCGGGRPETVAETSAGNAWSLIVLLLFIHLDSLAKQ